MVSPCLNVQCYGGNLTEFVHESVSYLQNYSDTYMTNKWQSGFHRVHLSEENLIVSEDQERKPTSIGPLTGVKCKPQRNAHKSATLPVS